MFTEGVARLLQRELPDIATTERVPDKRRGRVYLDFLQNRKSQTIVPPYSVRPVRGASVSTPLLWDELEDASLSPGRFTIHTVPERLRGRGDLFRAALADGQDLLPAIDALRQLLRGRWSASAGAAAPVRPSGCSDRRRDTRANGCAPPPALQPPPARRRGCSGHRRSAAPAAAPGGTRRSLRPAAAARRARCRGCSTPRRSRGP